MRCGKTIANAFKGHVYLKVKKWTAYNIKDYDQLVVDSLLAIYMKHISI